MTTSKSSRRPVVALLAAALAGPAAAQSVPSLPDFDALLAQRIEPIQEAHQAKIAMYDGSYSRSGPLHTLLLDRVSLTGSYGRGLTLASKTEKEEITDTLKDETKGSWAVTWTLPFKALSERKNLRAELAQKRAAAEAELRAALADAEWKMREIYEDYRLARQRYEGSPQTASVAQDAAVERTEILKAGLTMRKLALQLLVLADHRGQAFRLWQDFRPTAPRRDTLVAARPSD